MSELLPWFFYESCPKGLQIIEGEDAEVVVLFPEDPMLIQRISALPFVRKIRVRREPSVDYRRVVERSFRPLSVSGFRILAPWHRDGKGDGIVIRPGLAFGTGRHESTKIMIRLMKSIDIKGKRVVDVGCGSGILSIVAKRLGAGKVFAIDRDRDAVFSARENIFLNRVENISLACVDLDSLRGKFHVVLANLDTETFKTRAGKLLDLLDAQGTLVLSGILKGSVGEVSALFPTLRRTKSLTMGDFCGLVLQR